MPRLDNQKTDYLTKFGSSASSSGIQKITVLTAERSTTELKVGEVYEDGDWRLHIFNFLKTGQFSDKEDKVR